MAGEVSDSGPAVRGHGYDAASKRVVEPGVLGGGGSEKAFQVLLADHFTHKFLWAVEEREKTVPIDGEQEVLVGSNQRSAGRESVLASFEAGYAHALHWIDIGKFGHEDEVVVAGRSEGIEEVRLEQGLSLIHI